MTTWFRWLVKKYWTWKRGTSSQVKIFVPWFDGILMTINADGGSLTMKGNIKCLFNVKLFYQAFYCNGLHSITSFLDACRGLYSHAQKTENKRRQAPRCWTTELSSVKITYANPRALITRTTLHNLSSLQHDSHSKLHHFRTCLCILEWADTNIKSSLR